MAEKTAVTARVERKGGGMPRYAFLRPWWSDINGSRFLTRFIILFTPLCGLHVTRIHMADNAREWPHDHSRTFFSLKFGWYEELVFGDPDDFHVRQHRRHRRFSCHRLRYTQAHSISRVSPHLVTVLFLGPARQKSGYWTPDGRQLTGLESDDG